MCFFFLLFFYEYQYCIISKETLLLIVTRNIHVHVRIAQNITENVCITCMPPWLKIENVYNRITEQTICSYAFIRVNRNL
jgi:hypothetical protein